MRCYWISSRECTDCIVARRSPANERAIALFLRNFARCTQEKPLVQTLLSIFVITRRAKCYHFHEVAKSLLLCSVASPSLFTSLPFASFPRRPFYLLAPPQVSRGFLRRVANISTWIPFFAGKGGAGINGFSLQPAMQPRGRLLVQN